MMNFKSTLICCVQCGLVVLTCAAFAQTGAQGSVDPVQVYAAGSLRAPMTKIASEYQERTGLKIVLTFGASGLLRERIEKGEPASVFASADTTHPQRVADGGKWHAPVVFVRNAMCALTGDKAFAEPSSRRCASVLRHRSLIHRVITPGHFLRRRRLSRRERSGHWMPRLSSSQVQRIHRNHQPGEHVTDGLWMRGRRTYSLRTTPMQSQPRPRYLV